MVLLLKTLCKIKDDFVGSISNVVAKQPINVDLVTLKGLQ